MVSVLKSTNSRVTLKAPDSSPRGFRLHLSLVWVFGKILVMSPKVKWPAVQGLCHRGLAAALQVARATVCIGEGR